METDRYIDTDIYKNIDIDKDIHRYGNRDRYR